MQNLANVASPEKHCLTLSETPLRVAIIVVNYNGTEDTLKCLDSLRALDQSGCSTVVVDNGSVPSAAPLFAEAYPWAMVIRCDRNRGWAGGNNVGIEYALARGAEQLILLNNDTEVAPDLVRRLLLAAHNQPYYGILGPLVCYMDDPDEIQMDSCVFNATGHPSFFSRQRVPVVIATPPQVIDAEIVYGCCMMISAHVFRRIGLIDERFFLIHEESDFCLRARRAGIRCGIVSEPLVLHKGSSSFKRSAKPLQRYYDARNLHLLLRKHAGTYRNGESTFRSWVKYFQHVYYMYCLQRDAGNERGADAVLEGVYDAFVDHYGPFAARPRPALGVLRLAFAGWRRLRARHASGSTQKEVQHAA